MHENPHSVAANVPISEGSWCVSMSAVHQRRHVLRSGLGCRLNGLIQLEQLVEEMMGRKATVVREGETIETGTEGERNDLRGACEGRRRTTQLKGGCLVKEIKDGHRGEESEQACVAIKGIDLLPLGREENVGELRRRNALKT